MRRTDSSSSMRNDSRRWCQVGGSRSHLLHDEERANRGANDALEIATEMRFRDLSVFAALADDNELAARFEFLERLDERAVALDRSDVGDSRCSELVASVVEDRLALEACDATLGFLELRQFLCELAARVDADTAGARHP